jgi:hypothetical protein
MSEVFSPTIPVNGNASEALSEFSKLNKRSLDFIFGAQKAFLDEIINVNNDAFERACCELSVASEFVSKLAEAHSVKAVMDVCDDCRKHQTDVLRRDNERLFKCSQRILDRTADFLSNSTSQKPA